MMSIRRRPNAAASSSCRLSLLLLPQPGERPLPAPGVILLAARVAERCGFGDREELQRQAQAVVDALGDPFWQAQTQWQLAQRTLHQMQAADADGHGPVSSAAAIARLHEAGVALARSGEAWSLGQCFLVLGELEADAEQADMPSDARQDFGQAALAFARVHAHSPQGQALLAEAQLWEPPHPGWDWSQAEACWRAAAEADADAGDAEGEADALASSAKASAHGSPLRATEDARQLMRVAVTRYRQLRLDNRADQLLAWFTPPSARRQGSDRVSTAGSIAGAQRSGSAAKGRSGSAANLPPGISRDE